MKEVKDTKYQSRKTYLDKQYDKIINFK